MNNTTKTNKMIENLLDLSKVQGYLFYRDIASHFSISEDIEEEDGLNNILDILSEAGVEIIPDESKSDYMDLDKNTIDDDSMSDDKLQELLANRKFASPITVNSVKSYMNEMGRVPLLNKYEETSLAKIIDDNNIILNKYYSNYHKLVIELIESYLHLKTSAQKQIEDFMLINPKHAPIEIYDVIKFSRIVNSYVYEDGSYYKIRSPVNVLNNDDSEDKIDISAATEVHKADKFNSFIELDELYGIFESMVDSYKKHLENIPDSMEAICKHFNRLKFSTRQSCLFQEHFNQFIDKIKLIETNILRILVDRIGLMHKDAVVLIVNQEITYEKLNSLQVDPILQEQIISLLNEIEEIVNLCGHTVAELKQDHSEMQDIIRESSSAKETMIRANLRLVISCAKKHIRRNVKLQFLDLVQEGNAGLMRAVDKFDYRLGYKFSTYATWWIRQSITRSMADQGKLIRVPVHIMETLNKYNRLMVSESEREEDIDLIKPAILKQLHISEKKIRNIINIAQEPLSTDIRIGDEGSANLSDIVEDCITLSPFKSASASNLKAAILEVLATLQVREAEVLKMRFGIDTDIDHTLEEVGKRFNVTRERIRQIEAKALRKLRRSTHFSILEDFIDS